MSGHSKWSQIKHKKGASDQKKGQAFGKLSKAITIAARGGADPRNNLKLKSVIEKARSLNMPNDSIERAIKKVSEKEASQLVEFQLEAMGPGNVAIIILGITDNTNRTIGELRTLIGKLNGKPVGEGSLAWIFDKTTREPQYFVDLTDEDATKLGALVEAVEEHEDVQNVFTNAQ